MQVLGDGSGDPGRALGFLSYGEKYVGAFTGRLIDGQLFDVEVFRELLEKSRDVHGSMIPVD